MNAIRHIEYAKFHAQGSFAWLSNLGDQEADTMGLAKVRRGGVLHRFYSDEAIQVFCENNDLVTPIIDQFGQVTAWCEHIGERLPIGWGA